MNKEEIVEYLREKHQVFFDQAEEKLKDEHPADVIGSFMFIFADALAQCICQVERSGTTGLLRDGVKKNIDTLIDRYKNLDEE